jgi:hypothetical protein
MRNSILILGVCLLPVLASAQAPATAAKPQTPAQTTAAKPAPPAVERKEIKVTDKVLKSYEGVYEMTPERTLTVTLKDGYLWGEPTAQTARQLFPESQTKFFLKDLDAQLTFRKDAKGVVTGALMQQAGRPDREMKKIK